MTPITIRSALMTDLDEIMLVEQESFGKIDPKAMATRATMAHRIQLCNKGSPAWFLVAVHNGEVVGDVILQPTNLGPDNCTSWEASTDQGQMTNTFHPEGKNLFAVSLAVGDDAPPGTADLLVHQSQILWLSTRRQFYMFCARMPGFQNASASHGTSREEYWRATRPDGSPQDWMLHEYFQMFGVKPQRLIPRGWEADEASGGHAVLFATDQPETALRSIARRIFRAGFVAGQKSKPKTHSPNVRRSDE